MKTAAKWDTAEFLSSDEDIAAYLNAALEDGDQALITTALGNIARAKGMAQLAQETGITLDRLYKALSTDGNPSFSTVQKVVKALVTSRLPRHGQEAEQPGPDSLIKYYEM